MYRLLKILFLFLNLTLIAQNQSVRFESLTISDGLSHNNVLSIAQNKDGFLWFGTADGLNRYDGYSYKQYINQPSDSTSISNNVIRTICSTENGNLWIGTDDGLNLYDARKDCFVQYQANPENENGFSGKMINAIIEDRFNNIWIATNNAGLFRYHPKDNKFISYRFKLTDSTSIAADNITTVFEDSMGNIWAGTTSQGLCLLNKQTNHFIRFKSTPTDNKSLSSNVIRAVYQDKEGDIWVGTSNGINKIEIDSNKNVRFERFYKKDNGGNSVLDIYQGTDGILKISYLREGIYHFNKHEKSFSPFINIESPNYNFPIINKIFEDKSGIFWFATNGKGVQKHSVQKSHFGHIKKIPGESNTLSGDLVNAICETDNNTLWIGTADAGLCKMTNIQGKTKFTSYSPPINNKRALDFKNITSIIEDDKGRIWIGTTNGVLSYMPHELDAVGYLSEKFLVQSNGIDITATTWHIRQDKDRIFWLSVLGGLIRYDYYNADNQNPKHTFYQSTQENSVLSNARVWSSFEDSRGNIWVATSYGLNLLNKNNGNNKIFTHNDKDKNSISHNSVKSIFEDSKGNIWIGTMGGGLNLYDYATDRFTTYNRSFGLPNDVVYGIEEDNRGNIWISTNCGLARLNPIDKSFKKYFEGDGLQSNEFRMGASHKGKSGKLYFGGINGLNAFYADSIKKDVFPPTVLITKFFCYHKEIHPMQEVNNTIILQQSITHTKEIKLPYGIKSFSFEFTALQYYNPLKNKYLYKLEGFDENWIAADALNRTTTYTNLNPGKYTLIVKASNSDDVWSTQTATINIEIVPPFYYTLLFYLIISIIIVGLTLFLFIYRERKHKRHNAKVRHERDLLQTLMDTIPDSIYYKDKNSRFIRINKKKAEDIGIVKPEVAIGKSDFDFFEKDDARESFRDELDIIKTGKPLINKIERRIRRGKWDWFSTTKVPILNNQGEIIGTVGITRDITAQKEIEEQLHDAKLKAEESDRLKSAFLANMSHEIRTPLNAIIGFSDLIDDDTLSSTDRTAYSGYIRSNSNSLLHLINDILDISKIEANQISIQKDICMINQLFDELLITFNQTLVAQNKSSKIILKSKKNINDPNYKVFADPYRLKQILSNLIINAIKFTSKGEIEFGYSLINFDTLQFYVSDTGMGIEESRIEHVFERFNHLDNKNIANNSGTGLGLYISKRLSQLMGGKIWVESKYGEGSTFCFTITGINFE